MFRKMRRTGQYLTKKECEEILNSTDDGVLAVLGDDDYPYTVPLNYVYYNSKIYFHCAKTGHKIDALKKHDKVSFCVVGENKVMPEKYATYYRSVVVFGRARILDNPDEMRRAVTILSEKYCHDDSDGIKREVEKDLPALSMIEITIEHMTGKEAKDLALAKKDKKEEYNG